MANIANRVQETTTTGGTGTLTLGGAVTGYVTFSSAFSTGTVVFYTVDNGAGEWEIGVGTLVTASTLSRDTVINSSNSNALVNFSSGTKRVFCSAPTQVLLPNQTSNSGKLLSTDGTNPSWTTTLNGVTIGNVTAGSGAFTTLSASSTVSGTGFSTYLASPPAIGSTTPSSGSFTTLSTTGNVTLGDASADTVTFNAATVTLNNSTTISAASTKTLTLNGGAGTNGLVLDASNNVGIGTSSPGKILDIVSGSAGGANIGLNNGNAATTLYNIYSVGSFTTGFNNSGSTVNGLPTGVCGHWMQQAYPMIFATSGSERMRLDASGNLGLGVTPSAWGSGYKAFEETAGAFSSLGTSGIYLSQNSYYNGTNWIYKTSSTASSYVQAGAYHAWNVASSGTAGNAISFTQAMTLDASGNLGIGTSSPGAKLTILSATNNGIAVNDGTVNTIVYNSSTGNGSIGTTTNHPLDFYTNNGSRMRLDASGNLGLGVTPSAWSSAFGVFDIKNYGALSTGNDPSLHLTVNAYYNGASWAYKAGSIPAVKYSQYAGGHYWYTASSGTAGNAFTFTQAMTLDASGNLNLGTTGVTDFRAVVYRNDNQGIITLRNYLSTGLTYDQFQILVTNAASSGFYFIKCYTSGGVAAPYTVRGDGLITSAYLLGGATTLSVDASGNIIRTPSDRNLKINDESIPYGLAEVNRMRPVIHEWTESANMGDGKSIGFIAQEVESIVPEVISGNESKSLDYGKLTAVLTKAIQELHSEIESLKAKVN